MATADTSLCSGRNWFECPVCVEIFRDPRQLACGDHFCRSCLEGVAAVHPTGAVTCPSCRAVTEISPGKKVADLPRSVTINEFQQIFLESESINTGERMCDPCGKNYQCRECLCSQCLNKHLKAPIYEGHATDGVLFCQKHESQAATLYCIACSTVICARCCAGEHECNKVDNVGNVAKNRLNKIFEKIDRDQTGNEWFKIRLAMASAKEREFGGGSKVSNSGWGCRQNVFCAKGFFPEYEDIFGEVNQPPGTMTCQETFTKLDGHMDARGSIAINYMFESGAQGRNHPRPGKPYRGLRQTAYLPDNAEGREIRELLKRAFDAKKLFTIGRSTTTGLDKVTWNDIHHKTNQYGGPDMFGYPDQTYLARVKAELALKGIY